jgi:hypothetical protein
MQIPYTKPLDAQEARFPLSAAVYLLCTGVSSLVADSFRRAR